MERMKTLYFRQPFFIGKLQNFNSLNKSYKPLKGQTKKVKGKKISPFLRLSVFLLSTLLPIIHHWLTS